MAENNTHIFLIGAGLPRTGTLSMKTALSHLLPGKCYHMIEVFQGDQEDVNVWINAANKNMNPDDWRQYFGKKNVVAGVDFPFSFFWKDLLKAFPDAKVVLTTRDPHKWYQSVYNSTYQMALVLERSPMIKQLIHLFDRRQPSVFDLMVPINENIPDGCKVSLKSAIEGGPQVAATFFDDWESEVRRHVPEDKLLVHTASQGWGPLCQFIGLPEPDVNYPLVNDTASVKRMTSFIWIVNFIIVYVLSGLVAFGLYYCFC